ncbi:MAG: aldo/keto reductase [Bacillota bacterium]
MIPQVRFGRTNLHVSRIALGGYPLGVGCKARGWEPFSVEGRAAAIRTVQAALDVGINYIDTSPGYGDGHSESVIGEAVQQRRSQVILASRVGFRGCSPGDVRASVESSLRRLRTEVIDIIQFDGGTYKQEDVRQILREDLLEMLETLREQGKVRFLGLVVDEPWTARPLLASFRFDVLQVRYNLIDQSAGRHLLNEARELDMGVVAMQPMTGGIFQRLGQALLLHLAEPRDLDEMALKFVLSDSRVHVAAMDFCGAEDVARHAAIAALLEPPLDVAKLPHPTADADRAGDDGPVVAD